MLISNIHMNIQQGLRRYTRENLLQAMDTACDDIGIVSCQGWDQAQEVNSFPVV